MITEIGGTVGDIESLPFLEAARQVRHDIGRDNCFFLHVSLVPYIGPSRRAEDQADPALGGRAAQRSASSPTRSSAAPTVRCPRRLKHKISLICDVDRRGRGHRAPTRRASTTSPRCCTARGSTPTSCAGSTCRFRDVDWTTWDDLLRRVHHPTRGGHRRAWSASTSTCPTPTCRWPRRCARAASRTRPRCTCAGSPPTSARRRVGRGPAAARRRRDAACRAASASAASRARWAR